ncbi:EF-hand domain-containing protein [Limnoglobus roseus]|uniref:Calmodulin n=1 Tax=Limnoglobus roseus TaxID=2598579 RepID=A0A5C1AAM7_9BACT|nr:EF-hand domain-containing protein [Limnoglobus roseus]QEL14872.1 calmodulin [Limnoglobus roseus]
MKRFLLSLFAATTSALAAAEPPLAPSRGLPRPTGPRGDAFVLGAVAPPQRSLQRVLPAFQYDAKTAFPDTLEIVYLANARPIHVRVTLKVNGKPLHEVWQAHLRKLFDAFDRDHDGSLNRFEVENIFSPKGLSGLLGGTYYHGAGDDGKSLEDLDRDADGRVSFAEFAAGYTEAAADLVRLRSLALDDSVDQALTKELFQRLDANGDGKLSKAELAGAESILLALDTDENETLSADEVRSVPKVTADFPGMVQPAPTPPKQPERDPNLELYRGPIPGTVVQLMLKKYDANKDFALTRAEIGLEAEAFAKLDANGDGKLSAAELDGWRTTEPDFTAVVDVVQDYAKRFAEMKPRGGKLPAGCELRTGENGRVVLRIGNQLLDISTATPPPGAIALRTTEQLNSAYPTDKQVVTENDINGPQFQFLRVVFDAADLNGDGKLTKKEFRQYLELQEETIALALSASFATRRPSLFQLLDDNGDNQLGVRELRTAWQRLIVLEPTGGDAVTQAALQPSAAVRLGFAAFAGQDYSLPANMFAKPGARKQVAPLWFHKMDRNGDGDVSRAEFLGPREKFDELDTDHDGLISAAEADAQDKKLRAKK